MLVLYCTNIFVLKFNWCLVLPVYLLFEWNFSILGKYQDLGQLQNECIFQITYYSLEYYFFCHNQMITENIAIYNKWRFKEYCHSTGEKKQLNHKSLLFLNIWARIYDGLARIMVFFRDKILLSIVVDTQFILRI